jgi:hypothetical protein
MTVPLVDARDHCDGLELYHDKTAKNLLSLLVALEKIQTVKSLAAARTRAGKHCFRVVIEFMSSSMLCSGEDLAKH